MLTKLRGKHKKRILIVLTCIIVPAFVLWGASSMRAKKPAIACIIDGKKIVQTDFYEYIKLSLIYLMFVTPEGQNITNQDIESLSFEFLLTLWKADKEKIKVSDSEVITYIKKIPIFSSRGKFNQVRYQRFLETVSRRYNLSLTPRDFEECIRNFIKRTKLLEKHINPEITDEEIRNLYKKKNQKFKIAYLFFPYSKFKININISESRLSEFYKNNKNIFRQEPRIKVKYIIFDKFDSNRKTILEAVEKDNKISKIADDFSLKTKETDFIGIDDPIEGIGWKPKINKIAFSLKLNKIGPVIGTDENLIIFEKIAEKPAFIPPYVSIKNEVKEAFVLNNAKKEALALANSVLKNIKEQNTEDLKKVNDNNIADFKTTGYFKYIDYIEGIGLDEQISAMIFSLKKGEIHPKVLIRKDGIFIIQLIESTPFDSEDFEKNKSKYIDIVAKTKEIIDRIKFLTLLKDEANLKIILEQEK